MAEADFSDDMLEEEIGFFKSVLLFQPGLEALDWMLMGLFPAILVVELLLEAEV